MVSMTVYVYVRFFTETMNKFVAAHEPTQDLNRKRFVLLCLGIPTLFWFARFKGKRTPDKILSSLFLIINWSYIWIFYNNTGRYK